MDFIVLSSTLLVFNWEEKFLKVETSDLIPIMSDTQLKKIKATTREFFLSALFFICADNKITQELLTGTKFINGN